jgi:hypothetical protein
MVVEIGQMKATTYKKLSTWLNAAGYAWSMGQADWLYGELDGKLVNVAVDFWVRMEDIKDEERATNNLALYLTELGIDPKVHRHHNK